MQRRLPLPAVGRSTTAHPACPDSPARPPLSPEWRLSRAIARGQDMQREFQRIKTENEVCGRTPFTE